jgi:hypothetical protein
MERVAGGGVPDVQVVKKKDLIVFLSYFLGFFVLNFRTMM